MQMKPIANILFRTIFSEHKTFIKNTQIYIY